MKRTISLLALASLACCVSANPFSRRTSSPKLTSNLDVISKYWGQLTPYSKNPENYFGTQDVGIPNGCQVEHVHLIERRGSRFPTGAFDDGANNENFAGKVMNWTMENSTALFTVPLTFLNSWEYVMGESYLVGGGASQSFDAGTRFWAQYGRVLYNATVGQLAYNETLANGTERPKLTL
jgi:hypothetical protein